MHSTVIVVIAFTLLGMSHSACLFNRRFTFPANYHCRIGKGKLVFRNDGNLIIYDEDGRALWTSGTSGTGDHAVYQGDGNLVIYDRAHKSLFSTGTAGRGRILIFQDDHNLVIYDNANHALWASNTWLT